VCRESRLAEVRLSSEAGLKTSEAGGGSFDSNLQMRWNSSALAQAFLFAREYWPGLAGISAVLLVPCFWHRTIVATDLGSHVYNAWLAQLIRHGQAPGLWIARQYTNVLFDFLLSGFGSLFGFAAAEKLAVAVCVLVFFWGSVALVCAAAGRIPWFMLPVLALVTYGWTFHMGFFNYYLALGLSFFCLAIFWRGQGWERLIGVAIAPFVLMAHPFGFIWLVAATVYIALAEITPRRYQFAWVIPAGATFLFVHYYFWRHYIVEAEPGRFYEFNGLDQLILFSRRYYIPERALLAFVIVAVASDAIFRRKEREWWRGYGIPLQLYLIAELAIVLFPRGVHFPGHVAIALITDRLTTISAVLGCCILGAVRPKKWHLAASLAIAALFFSFLYEDTGTIDKMEMQVERLVRTLPPGQRVMATILPLTDSRIFAQHIVDRACIGYCFDYGNYEPGSEVFRVRALPDNPYALDDYELAIDMEEGDYVVQPSDLPMDQVYQCTEKETDLCIRALQAGEENDRLGVHPDD
jgi:hypothetical protein